MPRAKPLWREVLNARRLRWAGLKLLVRLCPPLQSWLGFFPRPVDMIDTADAVLVDERVVVPAAEFAADRDFLDRCRAHDIAAAGFRIDDGVETGARTALFRKPWVDMKTSAVLLPHRCATVQMRSHGVNWNDCSARPGRAQLPVSGRVFVALNTAQYFHMLMENGVRLLDLMARGDVDGPLTVLKAPDRTGTETAMFEGIARLYPDLAVQRVGTRVIAVPDEAVVHFPRGENWEWPPVTRPLAEQLAAGFAQVYGSPSANYGRRLFLTRRGAKLRQLTNEPEIEALLAARGFETFQARDDNHPEQIARFAAADVVVSVHGAGLTNLLFCRPCTRVIEIFPATQVKSTYWWISRQLGLHHVPVIGGEGDYHLHFPVDAELLAERLDSLMDGA